MSRESILVVDDSPTQLRLITDALDGKGYQISTATSGEDAIEKAGQVNPDLIILDIILPNQNGYQVCRQLKSTPATKDIKVVMLSTKDQDSDKFWGMKQGADDYLTKPFEEDDLLSAVRKLL